MRRNRHTNMNCPIDEMASKGLYVQDKAHRNHGKKLPKCSIFGSGPRWWSSALKFRESKIQRDLSALMLSSSTKSVQLSNATNTETTMPSAVAAYSVFMFCVWCLFFICLLLEWTSQSSCSSSLTATQPSCATATNDTFNNMLDILDIAIYWQ